MSVRDLLDDARQELASCREELRGTREALKAADAHSQKIDQEESTTTREDRVDTLLNAAALLIDTAINQIDPPGQVGVNNSTLEIQDACSTLRVARGLVEQARFFPEEAKVWIPNEAALAPAHSEPSLKGGVGGAAADAPGYMVLKGGGGGVDFPVFASGAAGTHSQHLYGAAAGLAKERGYVEDRIRTGHAVTPELWLKFAAMLRENAENTKKVPEVEDGG